MILYLLISLTLAQEVDGLNPKPIWQSFKEIDYANLNKAAMSLKEIREKGQSFKENKYKYCMGRFTQIKIVDGKEEHIPAKKLSYKERKACLGELKVFHKEFLDKVFESKKKFLVKIHEKQMKDWEAQKSKAIKELDISFKKNFKIP